MYDSRMPVKGTDYKKGDFKKLAGKLAAKGTRDPNALAAWIERRKYGAKKWAKIQSEGRKD
jgi:hypothetical protein